VNGIEFVVVVVRLIVVIADHSCMIGKSDRETYDLKL